MNLNKLERRIKELDKFFPLLDSKEEVEMIIASEEFQDEIFKIKKEFDNSRINIFVDDNYIHIIVYQIYKDDSRGFSYRIIY